jgi:hypothetical protein
MWIDHLQGRKMLVAVDKIIRHHILEDDNFNPSTMLGFKFQLLPKMEGFKFKDPPDVFMTIHFSDSDSM